MLGNAVYQHTGTAQVPGPKSHPRKILLLLIRLFVAAVLRDIGEGKEEEGEGVVVETG